MIGWFISTLFSGEMVPNPISQILYGRFGPQRLPVLARDGEAEALFDGQNDFDEVHSHRRTSAVDYPQLPPSSVFVTTKPISSIIL